MSYNNMSLLDADEVFAILQSRIAEIQSVVDILSSIQRYIGVTTTVLTDGATTNPILIDGESVTVISGDAAIYNGEDFAFNGEIWQSVPDALGALAYKNSASGSYTPEGTVSITPTTTNVVGSLSAGTLPSVSYDSNTETLTFNAGTLPSGTNAAVMTGASGSFSGTAATITVE